MSFWWGQSPFDEIVERATSELLPAGQENLALNLEIADQIRGKKVNAKDAMRSLKARMAHKNPNVQLLTLGLVDSCVKNGGEQFVREVASREFMEELTSIIRSPTGCNLDVKNKILYVVQVWGMAAKGNPALSYITDTYNFLKAEGFVFPSVNEHVDSIVLESSSAPEWSDSDVCERCRTAFTMTNRKHHCRQCGKTFCGQCSSKTMTLPHLAITEEVRVCDGCYMKNKLARIEKKESNDLSLPPFMQADPFQKRDHERSSSISKPPPTASEEEIDEDLKKAIELSLKEAERSKSAYGAGYAPPKREERKVTPPPVQQDEQDDPDLAAAIAASLQEMNVSQNYASQSRSYRAPSSTDLSTAEMENVLLFSTLMDRIRASSGEVGNDPEINALYTQIGAIQPKLVKSLDETNRKHRSFVDMHNKLNQAVKMYDRLLEERLATSYARGSHPAQNRVQSPHQYYASPSVSNGAYATPPTDQSSLYPNAVNYNAPQYPQPSGYEQNQESAYPAVPSSSSAPYTYNAPPPPSSYPASSYPAQQPPSGAPQEYQAQGSAPPQEYQPQPTPQGTAPPHQGFLPSQGYFPPTSQGTTPPQENYYAPQAPEANPNVPPAQNHFAPPNEYQPSAHGYVSPPGAPSYTPDPYYGAQPQQMVSPQQQPYGPQQQVPQQQQWDGYPQQPYPQQHDRNSFSLPGAVPPQKQQPVVEEAPLIDL
ncbi:hypothetical protein BC943DRAFT_361915 [Umbelopsis sp. AD052]|nr:hypothetical protein BC943DRAFT_361915 [Umbelopsis sp. AD052]